MKETNRISLSPAEARALLARFDEGLTSPAEEQALYAFFRSAALPPDFAPLRGLMAWYEGGCQGEPAAPEAPAKGGGVLRSWRASVAAAAASAAILITAGIALATGGGADSAAPDPFAEIYAGSYVIRNGVKITDPALIKDDILRAQQLADSTSRIIAEANADHALRYALERRYAGKPRMKELALKTIANY